MKFEELDEFKKDLQLLLKEYRTLKDDLEVVKRVLEVQPDERPFFSFRIGDTGANKNCIIIQTKITCRALRNGGANCGLRLVYAWFEVEQKIVLVELYDKKEKETENRSRIMKNFK